MLLVNFFPTSGWNRKIWEATRERDGHRQSGAVPCNADTGYAILIINTPNQKVLVRLIGSE